MIPHDFITEWRQYASWTEDSQVEQDLVICRALVEIFSLDAVARTLAFRGGTALHKLHLPPAARYSEDIDLVQMVAGPIGPVLDAMRGVLDPWLGEPKRVFKEGRVSLGYRMLSEGPPPVPMRLKIEVNSREHFTVFGLQEHPFTVESRWYAGSARIKTFHRDELLGTKLRALYQRKKGRDLFDLWAAQADGKVDSTRVVQCFLEYLNQEWAARLTGRVRGEPRGEACRPGLHAGCCTTSRTGRRVGLGRRGPLRPAGAAGPPAGQPVERSGLRTVTRRKAKDFVCYLENRECGQGCSLNSWRVDLRGARTSSLLGEQSQAVGSSPGVMWNRVRRPGSFLRGCESVQNDMKRRMRAGMESAAEML